MASITRAFDRDLELPGFPTTKRGILFSMHTIIMKMFSFRALFLAMFLYSPLSKTSWMKKFWHLSNKITNKILPNLMIRSLEP